jgi:uroporphyrinogen-III synthase
MKNILLTGLEKTNIKAKKLIEDSGHEAFSLPLQRMDFITGTQLPSEKFDWIILTSITAVQFFHQLKPNTAKTKIAAVGPSTAKSLEALGYHVDLTPENDFSIMGLIPLFPQEPKLSILYPCSEMAQITLESKLREKGHTVKRINTYRPLELPTEELPNFTDIVFFSPSGVEFFHKKYGSISLTNKKAVAIGKSTATAFKNIFHVSPTLAKESTVAGTIKALL